MKEILLQFATYNYWANQKIVDFLAKLPKEITDKDTQSSFKSIHLTLKHLKTVEYNWWQRMRLVESIHVIQDNHYSIADTAKELLQFSLQWKDWVEKSTTAAFEHQFSYQNTKKEQFKQPVFQMLIHLFNHQSYHRGQIVTMLRQAGVENIPATDFIIWSRGSRNL